MRKIIYLYSLSVVFIEDDLFARCKVRLREITQKKRRRIGEKRNVEIRQDLFRETPFQCFTVFYTKREHFVSSSVLKGKMEFVRDVFRFSMYVALFRIRKMKIYRG